MKKLSPCRLDCGTMLLAVLLAGPAAADEFGKQLEEQALVKEQTVMITVTSMDGKEEFGAGVVLCQKEGLVHVLTAYHVLAGGKPPPPSKPRSVPRRPALTEISFFHGSPANVVDDRAVGERAIIPHRVPNEDLLLLSFRLEPMLPSTASLAAPSSDIEGAEEDEQATVRAVGNPTSSMETWAEEKGKLLSRGGKFLRHSAQISGGFSGGPLFDEAGALIGINLLQVVGDSSGEEKHGEALAVEQFLPAIDKWVPADCLKSASPLTELAHLTYRKAMREISTKNWEKAKELMSLALEHQPLEGGSVHLQGMRYTRYLPHYHLGLAYYKLNDFTEAIREWDRSEAQAAIRQDKRYRKLRKDRERCYEKLRSLRAEADPAGP